MVERRVDDGLGTGGGLTQPLQVVDVAADDRGSGAEEGIGIGVGPAEADHVLLTATRDTLLDET